MTKLSTTGRNTLSSKASAQKATGAGGKFGHLKSTPSSDTLTRAGGSVQRKFANAAMEAFGGAWNDIDSPAYHDGLATMDVRNPFGIWAHIGYSFDEKQLIGYLYDETKLTPEQCEEFLLGVTVGKDGVHRTSVEAFTLFRDLYEQNIPKKAQRKKPAKSTPPTRGYKLEDDVKRWLSPDDVRDIENGTIPTDDDERIASGEVFDKVYDTESKVLWHRAVSKNSWPTADVYGMRFQTSRALDDEERLHLAGLIGYAWAMGGRGEGCDLPMPGPSGNVFSIGADSTKSRGDAPGKVLENLDKFVSEGTPSRKTKGGTRLVEAFPDPDLKVEIYFDSPMMS